MPDRSEVLFNRNYDSIRRRVPNPKPRTPMRIDPGVFAENPPFLPADPTARKKGGVAATHPQWFYNDGSPPADFEETRRDIEQALIDFLSGRRLMCRVEPQ